MGYILWVKTKPVGERKFGKWERFRQTPYRTKEEVKEAKKFFRGDPHFKLKVEARIRARKKLRDIGVYW